MAKLRVFVSSTCYDLGVLRSELRPFISGMGYEPVMSEYSDVLFDPRSHTHDSCVKEISGCDMVVLIVGSRFGGVAVPTAKTDLDQSVLQKVLDKSFSVNLEEKFSITQLEVLKAISESVPIYAFVEATVLHDHLVYERNKDKRGVVDEIEFPSIQKKETAKYIFEFINVLQHRVINNSITSFSRLDEIRSHLSAQWSQLFQRLLLESRTQSREMRRYKDVSEQIEDLKTVILASITTPGLRDTAKGAVQFRQLVTFISALRLDDHRSTLLSDAEWDDVLQEAGVVEIRDMDEPAHPGRSGCYLVLSDGTFYRYLLSQRSIVRFGEDWREFRRLEVHAREAIVDALLEDRAGRGYPMLRYIAKPFADYLAERDESHESDEDIPF